MKKLLIALTGGSLLACGGLCGVGYFLLASFTNIPQIITTTTVGESITFELPDSLGHIRYSRTLEHGFLPEYSRSVTFFAPTKSNSSVDLRFDTGGGQPINVYLIRCPQGYYLRLDDPKSEHVLDLSTNVMYQIERVDGTPYVGRSLPDGNADLDIMWASTDDEPLTLIVEGDPGIALDKWLSDSTETYLGCIEGRPGKLKFYSAAEKPESKLDKDYQYESPPEL